MNIEELLEADTAVAIEHFKTLTDLNAIYEDDFTLLTGLISKFGWKKESQELKIKALLEMGANPDLKDGRGRLPLFEAVGRNGLAYLNVLLESGANPNIEFEHKYERRIPLIRQIVMLRIYEEGAAVILRLLEAGLDPNLCGDNGMTAMHYLLESELYATPELVQALLAKGADISIADALGKTALSIALALEKRLIVSMLLEADASPTAGEAPALCIVAGYRKEDVPLLKSLFEAGARLGDVDKRGWTALHFAVYRSHASAVEWLISVGAVVDVAEEDGRTPLMLAINNRNIAIVELLLNAGGSLSVTDHEGRAPIFYALLNNDYLKILKQLLRAGAKVNVQDHNGITPLMEAVGNDNGWNKILDVTCVLLEAKADVHLRDKNSCTALHHACETFFNVGSVIPVLIKAGAEINAQDNEGITPLMHANAKCTEELLQHSPNLELTDKHGKTALIHAAKGDADKLKLLISAGANLDHRDNEGRTALMFAVNSWNSADKLTKILIDAGADVDVVDVSGKSATAHARPDALRLLIAAKATPNPLESEPLLYALEENDFPLAITLFQRGARLSLKFPVFVKNKRALEKLARGRSELLRSGIECQDGETAEELGKLLAKYSREAAVAWGEELPAVLREEGSFLAPSTSMLTKVPTESILGRLPVYKARVAWDGDECKKAMRAVRRSTSELALSSSRQAIEKFRRKPFSISVAKLSADAEGFVSLWNEAPAKLVSNMHSKKTWWGKARLDANDVTGLLAHFGVAILPGLLVLARKKPALVMPSLMKCDSPDCALFMAENLRGKYARNARQWLDTYHEAAIFGLLPPAIGHSGKLRDVAGCGLRYIQRKGYSEAISRIVSALGADASKAVDKVLSLENPSERLPEKMPSLPSFWCADIHPAPILIQSGKALPQHALDTIARLVLASSYDARVEALEDVSKVCTPSSLASFAWSLFEEWEEKGKKDTDGMFQVLGYWGDDECARKLTSYIRRWPQSSNTPRSLLGLEILAAIGTDTAMSQLQAIALKNKYRRTQERAVELVEAIARRRNMTRQQFEDRTVPTLGIENDGWMRLDFGRRQFLSGVDEKIRPIIMDSAGKPLKDLPNPGVNDDETLSKQAIAEWKEFRTELKVIAKLQLERLEQAMLKSRRWTGEEFRCWLLGNPLLAPAIRGLVWGMYRGRNKLIGTFVVAADGSLIGIDGKSVTVSNKTLVGIPHPLDINVAVAHWKMWFKNERRGQPFAQLARSVYRRSDDTEKNHFGLDGAVVPSKALKVMKGNGWGEEIGDAGWIWGFDKAGCSVTPEPGVHIDDYEWGGATEQTLEVSISEKLNDIEYSEIVRELQALRK